MGISMLRVDSNPDNIAAEIDGRVINNTFSLRPVFRFRLSKSPAYFARRRVLFVSALPVGLEAS